MDLPAIEPVFCGERSASNLTTSRPVTFILIKMYTLNVECSGFRDCYYLKVHCVTHCRKIGMCSLVVHNKHGYTCCTVHSMLNRWLAFGSASYIERSVRSERSFESIHASHTTHIVCLPNSIQRYLQSFQPHGPLIFIDIPENFVS
jgi:hypothetical protein